MIKLAIFKGKSFIHFRTMSNYLRLRNYGSREDAPKAEKNTCFVNTSLQLMNSIPDCRKYFVEKRYKTQDSQQLPICDQISAIFRTSPNVSNSAGSLRELIGGINGYGYLNDGEQQDMASFFTILLDEIDKEITAATGQ